MRRAIASPAADKLYRNPRVPILAIGKVFKKYLKTIYKYHDFQYQQKILFHYPESEIVFCLNGLWKKTNSLLDCLLVYAFLILDQMDYL